MITLLTGGSACGKSWLAEEICIHQDGPRYYIATMQPFGEAGREKVAKHRKMRQGKGFETIECYHGLEKVVIPERGTILLECIANLTANEQFLPDGTTCDPTEMVIAGVENLAKQCENLIIITNDVGSDGGHLDGEYTKETFDYIDYMGVANAKIAQMADAVFELVAGCPVVIKGELPDYARAKMEQMSEAKIGDNAGGDKKMILIVGAEASGKKTFAASLGYTDICDASVSGIEAGHKAICHIEALPESEPDAENWVDKFDDFECIIANEVGSGVIPIDPKARKGREGGGRLTILLARRADTVIRMVAGIPTVLKGSIEV